MQRDWLGERGVRDWFHLPFAWFGDRTAFAGFRTHTAAVLPERTGGWSAACRRASLDMAPIHRGFTADIGYSGCLGPTPCTTS